MNNENALYTQNTTQLTSFDLVEMDPVHIGTGEFPVLQSPCAIAIGDHAGYVLQQTCAIAIGHEAGTSNQGQNAIAVGVRAGQYDQSEYTIAMGYESGSLEQSTYAIAMGYQAGEGFQAVHAIALGTQAGQLNQSTGGLAIGALAGQSTQGLHAVALGTEAGRTGQGDYSIAIGYRAGQMNQPTKNIILNASGSALSSATKSEALYIAPMQNATAANVLYYNATSKEVSYGAAPSGGGGGEGQLYYLNGNEYFRNSYSTVSQTVTTQGLVPVPAFPTEPITPTFSGTVYSVSNEAQFDAALVSAVDGDIIQVPAATTITFTTIKTVNKSLEIRGVNSLTSVITASFAIAANFSLINISGVKADNITPNNNVYIHDLTITITNNTNDSGCIGAGTVSLNNTTGSTGLRFQNLILTTTEFCITVSAAEWVIKNCTMSYTPPSGAADTARHIIAYNIGTKGWIEGCTFNATTEYPTPRTIDILFGSVSYGSNSTGFAGDLVIKNNVQSVGNLRQFYIQEVFRSNGPTANPMPTNAFSIWAEGNRFGPYSASAFVFYEGAGTLSPLNFFNTLYFVGNNSGQGFGTQKGLLSIDGLGAVRSPGAPARFIVSNNVIGDIFPSSFNGTYQSGSTIPNFLGINSTYFTVPSIVLRAASSSVFPILSREYLSLGYIPKTTWNFSIYASSTDLSGNTSFSINLGHTDSNGDNFTSLYSSSNFVVNSNIPTLFTSSFNTVYTNLASTTRRLKLNLILNQTNGTSLSFLFDPNAYLRSSGVENIIPKVAFTGAVSIASLAANTLTSQNVLFSYPFTSLPSLLNNVNTTSSTNGDYVLPSFSNLSLIGFTLNARNLHTSAAATAFSVNWNAL